MNRLSDRDSIDRRNSFRAFFPPFRDFFLPFQALFVVLLDCWNHLRINTHAKRIISLAQQSVIDRRTLAAEVNAHSGDAAVAAQVLHPQKGIQVARYLWDNGKRLRLSNSLARRLLDSILTGPCPISYRRWLLGKQADHPETAPPKSIPYFFTAGYGLQFLAKVGHPLPERFCLYSLENGHFSIFKYILQDLALEYGLDEARKFIDRLAVPLERLILACAVIYTGPYNRKVEKELYRSYFQQWSVQQPEAFAAATKALSAKKQAQLLVFPEKTAPTATSE